MMEVDGSSPLARGTRASTWYYIYLYRIIPARAGNTKPTARRCGTRSDHPRSRGEHTGMTRHGVEACGSSPLARGTQRQPGRKPARSRIIPARAGNTAWSIRSPRRRSDHPRSRGEHVCWNRVSSMMLRIIPARAGNTQVADTRYSFIADHPRSRGEHDDHWPVHLRLGGSSPLARGTRDPTGRPDQGQRIIPARAGNTCS